MITYSPLWKTLIDRRMTKTQLRELVNCSTGTLARMGKDDYVELRLIDKICQVLDCEIGDVISYKKEE